MNPMNTPNNQNNFSANQQFTAPQHQPHPQQSAPLNHYDFQATMAPKQLTRINERDEFEDDFNFGAIEPTSSRFNFDAFNQGKMNQMNSLRTVHTLNTNTTSLRSINRLGSGDSMDILTGI